MADIGRVNHAAADVTVLIDAPKLPRRGGRPCGSHAQGLTATLDWAAQSGLAGQHTLQPPHAGRSVLVVLRDDDPEALEAVRAHPSHPDVVNLAPHRPGTDPGGVITAALQRPYTLALHPGVTPGQPGDTLERAMQSLDDQPAVAAVSGRILREDGAGEAHPLPASLHLGAALLRTKTLHDAGGLSRLLCPGGAADLDLTCRLMRTGQTVQRFDDLIFRRQHWPTPSAPTGKQHAAALRDALIVIERYFPRPMRRALRRDAIHRAATLQGRLGMRGDFALAVQTARQSAQWEHRRGRSTLHADQLETLLGWSRTKHIVKEWSIRESVRRVVLAGWHPNLYAAFRAARHVGMTVTAVADDTLVPGGTSYRGAPLRRLRDVYDGHAEGVIVTDTHPATAEQTAHLVEQRFAGPVLRLYESRLLGESVPRRRAERPAPRLAA